VPDPQAQRRENRARPTGFKILGQRGAQRTARLADLLVRLGIDLDRRVGWLSRQELGEVLLQLAIARPRVLGQVISTGLEVPLHQLQLQVPQLPERDGGRWPGRQQAGQTPDDRIALQANGPQVLAGLRASVDRAGDQAADHCREQSRCTCDRGST
jgi:hypothetical protein